jgi:hypothetical protein
MHIFEAISKKLTIVTTSIEQRNFLMKAIDYMQAEQAFPFNADRELTCNWFKDSTYMFAFNDKCIEGSITNLSSCELTFNIKQLSAILGKHSSTVHQLLKRPENWSSHNIEGKNKCGKEIVVTLKFQ